jgi:site-specific recombinase XerD
MTGPLTPHAEGFAAELAAHGYTDLSAANQLRLMADLSRWLEAVHIPVAAIDHRTVVRFLAKRRRTHTQFITDRGLAPLLEYLGSIDAVAFARPTGGPASKLLQDYERYLVEERAVLAARRQLCLTIASEFLKRKRVATLTAKHVTRFVDRCAGRPNLLGVASALRSLLRFLFITSKTPRDLVYAVPSTPRWRLSSLPKFLEMSELKAVFATCDRRTLVGCRDYAVLLLLGRLGLRSCEVAALQLEDVEWTVGEILIRGKGKMLSRLPLPVDVGEAVVAYLRRASRSKTTRALFVRSRAPYDAISAGAVIAIGQRALRAAGITSGGAHRLRHTAATQMLRRGASFTEIAQVLRHRYVDTTAIYAKIDHDSLRSIARTWPLDILDGDSLRALAPSWPGGAR